MLVNFYCFIEVEFFFLTLRKKDEYWALFSAKIFMITTWQPIPISFNPWYNHNTSILNYQFLSYLVFLIFVLLLPAAEIFFVWSSSRILSVKDISHRNIGITFNNRIIFKHNYISVKHILIFMCLGRSLQIKTLRTTPWKESEKILLVFFTLGFVKFHFLLLFWFM